MIEAPKEELIATLGIEPEKIDEIVAMLKKGLEEAEIEEEGEERPVAEPKPATQPEQVAEKTEHEEPAPQDTKGVEE